MPTDLRPVELPDDDIEMMVGAADAAAVEPQATAEPETVEPEPEAIAPVLAEAPEIEVVAEEPEPIAAAAAAVVAEPEIEVVAEEPEPIAAAAAAVVAEPEIEVVAEEPEPIAAAAMPEPETEPEPPRPLPPPVAPAPAWTIVAPDAGEMRLSATRLAAARPRLSTARPGLRRSARPAGPAGLAEHAAGGLHGARCAGRLGRVEPERHQSTRLRGPGLRQLRSPALGHGSLLSSLWVAPRLSTARASRRTRLHEPPSTSSCVTQLSQMSRASSETKTPKTASCLTSSGATRPKTSDASQIAKAVMIAGTRMSAKVGRSIGTQR